MKPMHQSQKKKVPEQRIQEVATCVGESVCLSVGYSQIYLSFNLSCRVQIEVRTADIRTIQAIWHATFSSKCQILMFMFMRLPGKLESMKLQWHLDYNVLDIYGEDSESSS